MEKLKRIDKTNLLNWSYKKKNKEEIHPDLIIKISSGTTSNKSVPEVENWLSFQEEKHE